MKRYFFHVFSGGYFLLTSIFCFAAINSYTYLFLVKTPPYRWLEWFVGHASLLYWMALAAAIALRWRGRRDPWFAASWLAQLAVGIAFTWDRVAATIRNDGTAFAWSLAVLLPELLALCRETILREKQEPAPEGKTYFSYSNAVLIAVSAAVVSLAGVVARSRLLAEPWEFHLKQAEAALFTVAEYTWLALVVVTLLNLLQFVAVKVRSRSLVRPWAILFLASAVADIGLLRFLSGALSLEGWPAIVYATFVSIFVVTWIYGFCGPLLQMSEEVGRKTKAAWRRALMLWIVLSGLSLLCVALTAWSSVQDWNGLIGNSFFLLFWALLSLTVYRLRPRRTVYSLPGLIAVLLISGFLYSTLNHTAFLWAKQLGTTEDEVSLSLQQMRDSNEAWQLVDKAFHYQLDASCDEFCRTLRQYTNIRNARIHEPLHLVDELVPTRGVRPNIFIFIIDSLRPDYVGTYNPAVDFTPNLDALARDSVAMRNAFTQYAGTSLSEPAIWSGALLLHAHYMRPFENVNSLLTLARTDGYDVAVSYDYILRRILPPDQSLTLFDTDKPFMRMEISSTLEQLMRWMNNRPSQDHPILFYAQPMNIHILGKNDLPTRTAQNWRLRPGFNPRVSYQLHQVDEALGVFVRYLKDRGLYDDSIIVIASDHGDAFPGLPNLGPRIRKEHSTILFPEVMRVPLIVHLPRGLRARLVWDESRLATLTDITPSLYYLLGHRPLKQGLVFGQPLFFSTVEEMAQYHRDHVLLASDAAADYGLLSGDGRYLYTVYDSPRQTVLFDLQTDPKGTRNWVTEGAAQRYNQEILTDLQAIAQFYGYRPTGGSNGSFAWDSASDSP